MAPTAHAATCTAESRHVPNGHQPEMTTGVWDGYVPYVMGSPQSIPNCFTVHVNALRVLKDKWPSIVDAIEAG